MAEENEPVIVLKRKITLKTKGEAAAFTFNGKLKIKLLWESATDHDLCLFYRKKDGSEGGVFSDEYRGKKSDLGTLKVFPFIEHKGDERSTKAGVTKNEVIHVASLNEIDEAYICIVNYDAAIEGRDATFAQESARVELQSDSGDYLEVIADSTENGPIYCVCTIKNKDGVNSVIKSGGDKEHPEVMELGKAWRKIPGFKLITEED